MPFAPGDRVPAAVDAHPGRGVNYIGSKHSLLDFLEAGILGPLGQERGTFLDLFAGTGAVGRRFKSLGFRVLANDIQHYAYCLNRATVQLNRPPRFTGLRDIVGRPASESVFRLLNDLPGCDGFIYRTYCSKSRKATRSYFSEENGRRCDAIRKQIETWLSGGSITEDEYHYLIACLLEAADRVANTASIYGAFLKHLKASARKPLTMEPLPVVTSRRRHRAYNEEGSALAARAQCDVLYLDPPYNQRQYAANYHVLETISRYDAPRVRGLTGLRAYGHQKSAFCSPRRAVPALRRILETTRAAHVFLSYNSEGLMSRDEIESTMREVGRVEVLSRDYPRFRADVDRVNRVYKADRVTEFLFCLEKG